MTFPISSKTRLLIRQAIGYALGKIIVSEVTATKDSSSLWDTYGLAKGGTNEYNGRQVQINVPVGSIAAGEKSFVSSFDATNKDATMSPAFSAALTDGDTYEMWQDYTIEEVNNKINQAIIGATDDILLDKEDHSLIKLENIYEYTIPTGFVAIDQIEYEYSKGIYHLLSDCEVVWTAGTSVTATADATFEKVGTYCAKFVVAAGAASGATLCYKDISEVDISDCDKVDFWMYSSIAITAGQLQFMLGATAAIASPLETIDIPAMSAGTFYRHSISLANPHSDTAIISIGVRQASGVDVGAFTFYLDEVETVKDNSRIYRMLSPDFWTIVQASTNLLKLDENGYSKVGNNRLLRLTGYQVPAEISADTTSCDIDPDYVIAKTVGLLLVSRAGGSQVDPDEKFRQANFWLGIAETRLRQGRTPLRMNTRWVS